MKPSIEFTIHDYAADGDADGVRAELAKGVSVDARNDHDLTPLACAAMNPAANLQVIDLLLDSGASVNAAVEEGKSFPLGLAACSGNVETTRRLLDAGANIDATSSHGYTALIDCIYRLHASDQLASVVSLLCEHGANLDVETDYGESSLSVASYLGRFDIVRVLLDAGADPSPLGWTKLLSTAAIGSCDDLRQLLELNGLANEWDSFGRTPGLLVAMT